MPVDLPEALAEALPPLSALSLEWELATSPRSSVYVASRHGEQFAVKILRHGTVAERWPGLARLRSGVVPEGVRIREVGRVEERPALLMEYVHGVSLRRLLDGLRAWGSRLPPTAGLAVASSVGRALIAAHALEGGALVHGQLSATKVLCTLGGEVRVLGFGGPSIVPAAWLAEPDNAAPEVSRGEPADVLSDVYALGALISELVSGHTHRSGTSALIPGLDSAFEAVVRGALSDDPAERPYAVAELQTHLERCLERAEQVEGVSGQVALAAAVKARFPGGAPRVACAPAMPIRPRSMQPSWERAAQIAAEGSPAPADAAAPSLARLLGAETWDAAVASLPTQETPVRPLSGEAIAEWAESVAEVLPRLVSIPPPAPQAVAVVPLLEVAAEPEGGLPEAPRLFCVPTEDSTTPGTPLDPGSPLMPVSRIAPSFTAFELDWFTEGEAGRLDISGFSWLAARSPNARQVLSAGGVALLALVLFLARPHSPTGVPPVVAVPTAVAPVVVAPTPVAPVVVALTPVAPVLVPRVPAPVVLVTRPKAVHTRRVVHSHKLKRLADARASRLAHGR